jgi:hypothetical protein
MNLPVPENFKFAFEQLWRTSRHDAGSNGVLDSQYTRTWLREELPGLVYIKGRRPLITDRPEIARTVREQPVIGGGMFGYPRTT